MRGGCCGSPHDWPARHIPGSPPHRPRPPESQLTIKEETMGSSEPAYERLGAKVLSLPDVIAQSVGFMGPVFASAFVIPLVVGVISASGKGGGVASPLSVLIAAVGVFGLSGSCPGTSRRSTRPSR